MAVSELTIEDHRGSRRRRRCCRRRLRRLAVAFWFANAVASGVFGCCVGHLGRFILPVTQWVGGGVPGISASLVAHVDDLP